MFVCLLVFLAPHSHPSARFQFVHKHLQMHVLSFTSCLFLFFCNESSPVRGLKHTLWVAHTVYNWKSIFARQPRHILFSASRVLYQWELQCASFSAFCCLTIRVFSLRITGLQSTARFYFYCGIIWTQDLCHTRRAELYITRPILRFWKGERPSSVVSHEWCGLQLVDQVATDKQRQRRGCGEFSLDKRFPYKLSPKFDGGIVTRRL